MEPDLSLIVPCYNTPNIIENILILVEEVSMITDNYEIILVDDGSDSFPYITQSEYLKVITHETNSGKGSALISGFNKASGKIIAFIDSDLQIPASLLGQYYKIITGPRSPDALIGSKRHYNSQVDYPFLRRFLSFGFQNMNRVMFGLKVLDTQVGIKFFKKDALKDILPDLKTNGFAIDLEILSLIQKKELIILEAPVRIEESFGSTINLMSVVSMFFDSIKIWSRGKFKNE